MRNWFVGSLFFIGAAMFRMKGFSHVEDWLLNIAGVMAPCVALFPMAWPCPICHQLSLHLLHFPCAMAFFLCVASTCIFCADKTLKEMPPVPGRDRVIRRYRTAYRILATVMVLAPIAGWLLAYNSGQEALVAETAAVWAFGIYWIVKTLELKRSQVERRIMNGLLLMDPRKLH